MASSHSLVRISRPFAPPASSTICFRCHYRSIFPPKSSQPNSSLPKAPLRYASTSKWSQRLWGKPSPSRSTAPETMGPSAAAHTPDAKLETAENAATEYKPAVTWDGLPSIGGNQGIQWEREHVWEGFMSPTKLESRDDVSAAIYRALVEVFTLRGAGLDPVTKNTDGEDGTIEAMSRARIVQAEDGRATVEYTSEEVRDNVIAALTTVPDETLVALEEEGSEVEGSQDMELPGESEAKAKNEGAFEQEEQPSDMEVQNEEIFESEEQTDDGAASLAADRQPGTAGAARNTGRAGWLALFNGMPLDQWMGIVFPDPTIKFAVLKRVMQLTGQRISDPAIQEINSAKALLRHLVAKPKPKKLAERLTLNDQLLELPNVQLRERRWTPIDKEKEVGRWKVIEKELKERDLPVTGHL